MSSKIAKVILHRIDQLKFQWERFKEPPFHSENNPPKRVFLVIRKREFKYKGKRYIIINAPSQRFGCGFVWLEEGRDDRFLSILPTTLTWRNYPSYDEVHPAIEKDFFTYSYYYTDVLKIV